MPIVLRAFRILIAFGVALGVAHAHQEVILTIKPDGSIPEVPARFGQVRLVVEGLGTEGRVVRLRVGEYERRLPPCLADLIRSTAVEDIGLTASWHHDESILPYYVSVSFRDPGWDPASHFNAGYRFLFSLHDAELLEVERMEADWLGDGGSSRPVDRHEACR